jgi:hypothetical protein
MSMGRALRRHKDWVYDPKMQVFRVWEHIHGFRKAASAIHHSHTVLDDDDHAPLMALKADPYEPVVTLEDVVMKYLDHALEAGKGRVGGWVGTVKLSHTTATAIRTAFPHIDTPPEPPAPLTAQDHIDALVKMGATPVDDGFSRYLSLPSEMSP